MSLSWLFDVIKSRQANPKDGSYTNRLLLEGEDRILQKIGEESIELIIAAKGQGNDRLISEIADLTFHMLVLLAAKGLTPGDILTELKRRHQ